MVLVYIGIVLLMFFGALFYYWKKKNDLSGGDRGFVHCMFIYIQWLIGAAAFLVVMYLMWRLKFWQLFFFLGSAALVWIGRDRREKSGTVGKEGERVGWQTLKKRMRTFGFIGLALSGAAIVSKAFNLVNILFENTKQH